MKFENRKDQNEEKINAICNSKKRFFFTALFGWSFGFAFQR
jgi:hypothetical protein